ncbi:MAG: Hsp33 family molecular chaperone HslO [Sulfuricaulis sp.]
MQHAGLQRFIFEHAPIRAEIVRLDATWRAMLEQREYPPRVRGVLGELMATAVLLASTLKFDGRLNMQLQGNGPVSLLLVEFTRERKMRAVAQWKGEVPESPPLSEILGNGRLTMTIDPQNSDERYQAIVNIAGSSVAEAFENYFARSEQLATRLWLAADAHQAAGMLLQRLPDNPDVDDDAWMRAVRRGSTITRQELLALPVREIVHRLHRKEDSRPFSRIPVRSCCSCSRARAETVLRMLGHAETHSIIEEQGAISVECEFCGNRYEFEPIDAQRLFTTHGAATPTRH